jgi:hypothetical protein
LQCDPHYHRFAPPPQPYPQFLQTNKFFCPREAGIILLTARLCRAPGTETHEK